LHFAPDTEDALLFAALLVNTRAGASRSGEDELATPARLVELLRVSRYSGRVDGDEAERTAVAALRERVHALWRTDADGPDTRDQAVTEINTMLRESAALPQLRRHDGFDWHLHATEFDAPLVDRIQTEIAMAPAPSVRRRRLRRAPRRPVAQRLQTLLLRALQQPGQHDRVPRESAGTARQRVGRGYACARVTSHRWCTGSWMK
jgi:hypothetical protein